MKFTDLKSDFRNFEKILRFLTIFADILNSYDFFAQKYFFSEHFPNEKKYGDSTTSNILVVPRDARSEILKV